VVAQLWIERRGDTMPVRFGRSKEGQRMSLRRLVPVGLLAVGVTLLVGASSFARTGVGVDRQLSLLDQARLAHTELEPVKRGARIMAGENLTFGEPAAASSSAEALEASPTPGVTQNGVCNDQKAEANVGDTRTFWVHNFKLSMDIQKPFVLAAKTPHVYMWVDLTQYESVVTTAQAQAGAEHYESIYATDRAYFGREAQCDQLPYRSPPRMADIWSGPWYDADDDRHINIVNFDPDVGATVVAGYYSSGDEYPMTVNAHSNEGEFFYMNSLLFTPGTATYDSILAHEFFHMIQFANDANEETWLNEGMADVAIEVNGFGSLTSSHTSDYASNPQDQLTHWDGQLYDYGNAYSYSSYLLEHYGPADNPATPFKENYDLADDITNTERDGLAGLDDVLAANPNKPNLAPSYRTKNANDVYLDRAVANVINDRSVADGQYGYGQLAAFSVNPHGGSSSYPASGSGETAPYGDRIYVFDSAADGTFQVNADPTIPIVNNLTGMPSPTHELWGNRVDESVTFAERDALLPAGSSPHLKFGYWYDIEPDYDYAYLRVSTDGGNTWDNLACCGSTNTNPNGNNHGNGITGMSGAVLPVDGPSWQTADVDLSAYAGQTVKIRFEYVTDPAVLHPGFTVDDVELVAGATQIWPKATFESGLDGFTVGGNGAATFMRIEPSQANQLVLQLVKVGRGVGVSRFNGVSNGLKVSASGPMDSFRTYAIFTSMTPITSELYGFDWTAQATPPQALTPPTLTATGGSKIQLSWTPAGSAGARPPSSYVIQESTIFHKPIDDNAESGVAPNWTSETTGTGALGWSTSGNKTHSGSQSFWGTAPEGATDAASILRFNQPISLPTLGRTLLTFFDWHINESDDSVNIDVREAGAGAWTTVFSSGRSALPDEALPSLATEPMTERKVDLAAWKGKTIELRFRFQAGSANRPGSTPFGWYVDDIKLVTEDWKQLAETTGTSYTVTKTEAGTFFYRVAALYTQFALGPWSNVASAEAKPTPDLVVSNLEAKNSKSVREGDKVTVTATIKNIGVKSAAASKTEFRLDGTTVLGVVDTAAIPANNGTAQVSVSWDTRGVKGEHTLKATADVTNLIVEDSEGNNAGTLTVTVKGNKVQNGNFEQQNAAGQPESWSGQSTTAGTASSSSTGGTDGSHAAQMQGTGGNAALAGSPSWTSAPISVVGGETYDLTAAVKATGLSSAPSLGLLYLNGTGQVLDSVKVLTAPLTTTGFANLEKAVTIPLAVAQVRVTLSAFAATDLATAGTVTFDDIGLYAH
jgi:immune inhibitor InhA-like protein/CARDB protein